MAVTELVPDANTVLSSWNSAATIGQMGDPSNTSGLYYRNDVSTPNEVRFSFGALPSYASSVSQVRSRWRRGSEDGSNPGNYLIYLGGSTTAVESNVTQTGTVMTGYFGPLAKPGGGSWAVADVNGTEASSNAEKPSNVGNTTFSVYYYGLEVTYTVDGAGFACLVGSLAGAALGLAEMAGLARALHRRTGTLITPDEYLAAWRDIRGHRRPVTLLLGGAAMVA